MVNDNNGKTNFFIIHGAYGHPQENWFPWLQGKLEKLGYPVFVPKFPTPEGQTLTNWLKVFSKYQKYLNQDSIVIGHSLGPAFLLNVLQKLKTPIKAAFFVSGFTGNLGNPLFDKINETFANKQFNWGKIKHACHNFYVFHSDNDPYVPLKKAKELAKNLDAKLVIVPGAGHFNEKAGYTTFPLLLKEIKNFLKSSL